MEKDFKLNGLINPNNKDLTTEQELKRLNIVLYGLIIYTLESISEQQNKSFNSVRKDLQISINRQLKKEPKEFRDLFK